MNSLKKYLGIVWILVGPAAIIFMIWQAIEKVGLAYQSANALTDTAAKANAISLAGNTLLQWAIIIVIFIPIAIGLVIFGKYAYDNEYDQLPDNSEALEEL